MNHLLVAVRGPPPRKKADRLAEECRWLLFEFTDFPLQPPSSATFRQGQTFRLEPDVVYRKTIMFLFCVQE